MKIITINLTDIVKNGKKKCRDSFAGNGEGYKALLSKVEPDFLKELLRLSSCNKSEASRLAGIDRGTLDRKLKTHGISVNRLIKINEGGES